MQKDGSGLRKLAQPAGVPSLALSGNWLTSPDEMTVAFFSGKESAAGDAGKTQSIFTWGHRNVAVIPAAGGARRTITACVPVTTPEELRTFPAGACLAADAPAFTPNGKSIIYDRGAPNAEGSGTWVIDIDGKNERRMWPDTRGGGNVPLKNVP